MKSLLDMDGTISEWTILVILLEEIWTETRLKVAPEARDFFKKQQ